MSQTTSTMLYCCIDCISDRRAMYFTIGPLSTNADGGTRHGGHTLGTEDGNRLPEHCTPTRISFVSRYRRTGTEFPPSLSAKEVTRPRVVVCLEGRRSRNNWADRCRSPGTQVVLTCVVVLLNGERDVLNHVL